jgi:hypothetical protein
MRSSRRLLVFLAVALVERRHLPDPVMGCPKMGTKNRLSGLFFWLVKHQKMML